MGRPSRLLLLLLGAVVVIGPGLAFLPPPPPRAGPTPSSPTVALRQQHHHGVQRLQAQQQPPSPTDDEDDLFSRRELLVPAALSLASGILILSSGIRDERAYDAKHKEIFSSIADPTSYRRILEVGIGDAPNVPYYPEGATVTGIDPNLRPESLAVAQAKARQRGVTLEGQVATAEALPFPDGAFDAVISTLVFCTVRDPGRALREVSRVLRPGGKFLFFEHIWAEEGTFLHAQQAALDPLQQLLAGGCHLTRRTDELFLAAAGRGGGELGGGDIGREGGLGGGGQRALFARAERFEYLEQSTKWPIVRQVAGVLVK